ncbi:hypothetical protein [Streptomyces sp. NPDC048644]|uniref:hypothetical protein n=1 Tax=Streptomyces sp. NPDC048644 TaxID=3365582 RepID=UPI00371F43CF
MFRPAFLPLPSALADVDALKAAADAPVAGGATAAAAHAVAVSVAAGGTRS